ncbi:hypothetical protein BS47DRAFT_1382122 [Hydnum rufescens UP504]|uniref:Uncharacterized protein n=1 Tax=Hydnum rufescens UP504 TaxID=1448309 RepID=A0A9P6AY34_9AGAM|nr:hypothetical protein BS47DRAFT_1382122 [Hydnum rufescens UP504]
MSSNIGSMASAWASTLPLPPTIPARPMLPQGAPKSGRGGRPPNTSTWGGHRRRGRGAVASAPSGETPNGIADTTETSFNTSVRSDTAAVLSGEKTVSSINLPPSLPSRPPRPVPKRAKAPVHKADGVSNTDPAPPEITPVRPPHRRRGKASPRVSSTTIPPKPVSLVSIPEPPAPSSAAESHPEAHPSPSNINDLSTSSILDVSTTAQDMVSLMLPPTTDNAHRPNTPSTHSHIDWADDGDSADLPDLDDWGFASKPSRRRSSASKPSIVSTATPIPPISVDLATSPRVDTPSPLSAPNPVNNPNADVEPSVRKPKGRSPLDPGRAAEKNKLRNERGRERRKKKGDASALDGRLNPSGATHVVPSSPRGSRASKGSTMEDPSSSPPGSPAAGAREVTEPKASNEFGTSSIIASPAKSMESGEVREHDSSCVPSPSEVPQSTSDTPYRLNPVPTISPASIQSSTTVTLESASHFNSLPIPSRPSSSRREPFREGGARSSQNSPAGGASSSRHSPSPPKLPINGGHVHAHSHSTTRPIISPNALHQLTKSLSGGSRQHRPAVSAQ